MVGKLMEAASLWNSLRDPTETTGVLFENRTDNLVVFVLLLLLNVLEACQPRMSVLLALQAEAYQRELEIEKEKGADINENAGYFKVVGGRKRGKVYGTGVTKEYYYGSSSGSAACGGSRPGKSVCCSWQGW